MDSIKMGKYIQYRRKEMGLTQQELANRIFVTDKAISKWERGVGAPNIDLLEALSDALGVSVSELLSGDSNGQTNEINSSDLILESAQMYSAIEAKKRKKQFVIFCVIMIAFIVAIIIYAYSSRGHHFYHNLNSFESNAIYDSCIELENYAFNNIEDKLKDGMTLNKDEYDRIIYYIGSTQAALAYYPCVFPDGSEHSVQANSLREEIYSLNEYFQSIPTKGNKYIMYDTKNYRNLLLKIKEDRQNLDNLIRQWQIR